MSNKVEFFLCTFIKKDCEGTYFKNNDYYKGDLKKFFEGLYDIFDKKDTKKILSRNISGKNLVVSRFNKNQSEYISIPFGKLKKGVTFHMVDDTLQQLDTKLFEVTSMVFDTVKNIAIITKNRLGPNYTQIEEYLNSFIPKDFEYKIKIVPLLEDISIKNVGTPKYIKKVDLRLRLDDSTKKQYGTGLKSNKGQINSFVDYSTNQLNSTDISISFGFHYGKKEDSLDIECVKNLIEELELNEEIINQITLEYYNGEKKKTALYKNSSLIVDYYFDFRGEYLPSEYLLNNCEAAFQSEVMRYRPRMIEIKSNEKSISQVMGPLKLDWNPTESFED